MEIANPRRILAVSLADSTQHLSDVIRDLTGTIPSPSPPADSLAGTTHHLPLSTPYYKASVPVWLDLVSDPSEWASSFLSPEAKEVLDVLGGIVVVFSLPPPPLPSLSPSSASQSVLGSDPGPVAGGESEIESGSKSKSKNSVLPDEPSRSERARGLITHVGRVVREGLGGWEWDGVGLGVGVGDVEPGSELLDEWDDACAEWGLEFVHVPATRRGGSGPGDHGEERKNEFGEKMGISRAIEALQANDWSQGGLDEEGGEPSDLGEPAASARSKPSAPKDADEKDEDGDSFDPEDLEFGLDKEEFAGLKKAVQTAAEEHEEKEKSSKDKRGDLSGDNADSDEELQEEDLRKLEGMMKKLLAVRDTSAGLPEEQRKRLAKRAVDEVMKEL